MRGAVVEKEGKGQEREVFFIRPLMRYLKNTHSNSVQFQIKNTNVRDFIMQEEKEEDD